jgi:acylglycerol lipase
MTTREEHFTGHDGIKLFARSWMPAEPPRAAVVLIHGLLEHSGRHARTAAELVRHGFSVHAPDLRGHGRSEGPRCDVRSFDHYLLDFDIYFERVWAAAGDRPIFLMGNSMGGLLAALWTISRRPKIGGLILSGGLLALADGLFPWLRYLSPVAAVLAPGLRVARIPLDWLAHDRQVVESYRQDPLMFQGRFTVRVAVEILRAMKSLSKRAVSLSEPLLILHGGLDRICDPAGCRVFFENAVSTDKTFRLYDSFHHEVFDEPERNRVLTDLTTWLEQRVPVTDLAACRGNAKS